jgi:hypothetical protein
MKLFNLVDKNFNLLCELVTFSDGRCVVRWVNQPSSIVIWNNLDEFRSISCSPNLERQLIENIN